MYPPPISAFVQHLLSLQPEAPFVCLSPKEDITKQVHIRRHWKSCAALRQTDIQLRCIGAFSAKWSRIRYCRSEPWHVCLGKSQEDHFIAFRTHATIHHQASGLWLSCQEKHGAELWCCPSKLLFMSLFFDLFFPEISQKAFSSLSETLSGSVHQEARLKQSGSERWKILEFCSFWPSGYRICRWFSFWGNGCDCQVIWTSSETNCFQWSNHFHLNLLWKTCSSLLAFSALWIWTQL